MKSVRQPCFNDKTVERTRVCRYAMRRLASWNWPSPVTIDTSEAICVWICMCWPPEVQIELGNTHTINNRSEGPLRTGCDPFQIIVRIVCWGSLMLGVSAHGQICLLPTGTGQGIRGICLMRAWCITCIAKPGLWKLIQSRNGCLFPQEIAGWSKLVHGHGFCSQTEKTRVVNVSKSSLSLRLMHARLVGKAGNLWRSNANEMGGA